MADSPFPDAHSIPTDLTVQVREFHAKFGFPIRCEPVTKPQPVRDVHHRLRLMAAEFCEVMRAFDVATGGAEAVLVKAIDEASRGRGETWFVPLADVARELADLDYTVEGTRVTFGIPRVPVATEVHRANMEKVDPPPPYPVKPEGWEAPRIEELLARELSTSKD